MPLPVLTTEEVQFAEMLREGPHVRAPHGHLHEAGSRAGNRAGGKYLSVYQSGDLVIMQDADGEWFAKLVEKGLDINWALDSIYEAFYDYYDDEYEYITFVLVRDFGVFAAFYQPMANDVRGIGYDNQLGVDVFDTTETKVEGMIFMNYYGIWTSDREVSRYVFGQEFMHRWGSFTEIEHADIGAEELLGRDTAHWSYWLDTPNSPMEGNDWVDNLDGTWAIDLSTSTYSTLDMYLMGLAPPEEVGPQTFLRVEQVDQDAVGRDPASTPLFLEAESGPADDIVVPATSVVFSVDDIVAAEGARDPAYGDAPTQFRMAMVVVLLADDDLKDRDLEKIDELRLSWETDWEEDVLGRGDLVTTLGSSTAPTWGEPVDTGTGDSGSTATDTGDDDTGKAADTPAGCGCDGTGALPGAVLAASSLLLARRRTG